MLVDTSGTGSFRSATTDEERLLADILFGNINVGWRVDVSGLAAGSYDVYRYGPSNNSVGTGAITFAGIDLPGLTGRTDSVLEQGVSWEVVRVELGDEPLRISGSGFITGVSGLQIVPSVRQSLNVDLGFAEGPPGTAYGAAAGFAGHWNEVGFGVSALDDASGKPSGVSVAVAAAGTSSNAPATDADGWLLEDYIIEFSDPFSLTFNGLAPGDYRVFVYAPSGPSVETGALTIEGIAVASLPGDPASSLVEGASWASVDVTVGSDGLLDVTSAGGPIVGLAGIQIVSLARQALNVDFGEDFAQPGDAYGSASGQAGHWNEAPRGAWVLKDVAGEVSGVRLFVAGNAEGSHTSSAADDAEALLEDHVEGTGASTWLAWFTGLAPGDYAVYLYASSDPGLSTGSTTMDGVPLPSLSGVSNSELIEGLSWLRVDVSVDDFGLVLTGGNGSLLRPPLLS